ncbi:MAG TPA: hypothetical protein ENJ20_03370, partial [Bacteroidetes bacterium]|nr:hypothetical protein [Bacteroidota bacterium]
MKRHPLSHKDKKGFEQEPLPVLLFLGGAVFLLMIIGSGIIAVASNVQGIDIKEALPAFGKDSTPQLRQFMRCLLLFNHLLTFLVPALLTGIIFYRRKWTKELGLCPLPRPAPLVWGTLMIVASFPLAQAAFQANRQLVEKVAWLGSLVPAESATEHLLQGLLVMHTPFEMIFSLIVMALMPAVGEEMVFRGIVQNQLQKL